MTTSSLSLPARRDRLRPLALSLPRPELAVLLVAAGVLYMWALDRNGFANEYYSAAVRSMTTSWHAFVYGAFDTSGVMTVDKPPLALWVQALSARLFGFSSWSLLLPQALMGVGTVALTYDMTRRRFGRPAGFVAGLALVLTPVTVAIARHNNPDALLVLCCTAALWFVVRGLEDGRTRWIVLAGVAVGLGFEAKMAAALLVVPALVVAWLWVAPRGRAAAARGLAAGGAATAAVGLAWPLLIWLTPATDRPWVSGTSDNSIWSLIFGYNGLGRLFGQDGGPGGGVGPGAGGGAGGVFGGEPGAMRLLNEALGGQAGWLLGAAVAAGIGVLAITRLRRTDARTGWLLAVGGAGLTMAVAFSRAEGIFHPYYVSQLAPMIAALVGAGAGVILRGGLTARVLGPAFVLAGVATEWIVLRGTSDLAWLPTLLVAAGFGVAVLLAADVLGTRGRAIVAAAAVTALLLAPASWSLQTPGYAASGTFPAGGPATTGFGGPGAGGAGFAPPAGGMAGAGGPGSFGGDTSSLSAAVEYAQANGGGTIAVASQSGAAGSLITSGADVAALGGFSGRESQVSIGWLADAVEDGRIRWVLTSAAGGMGNDGRVGASEVMAAVEQVGTPVSSVDGLYDLQGAAEALRALTR
ncbi:MAG TPA: glycosyltransferase family 39 protein [Solirubrobacteraceae bacterium]|nr:glycosyltransferase family 39 protein [Solirubrobacteraceae bacterium]